MTYLALALIFLAFLVSLIASIWLLWLAFSRSVLWGLAVLFLPFASLFFLIVAWSEAKRPFFLSLARIGVFTGGIFLLRPEDRDIQSLLRWAEAHRVGAVNPAATAKAPPPPPAAPEPPVEVQLTWLRQRETALRARKAALQPGDRAGAEALTREIAQYNLDLKAALERKKAAVAQ